MHWERPSSLPPSHQPSFFRVGGRKHYFSEAVAHLSQDRRGGGLSPLKPPQPSLPRNPEIKGHPTSVVSSHSHLQNADEELINIPLETIRP